MGTADGTCVQNNRHNFRNCVLLKRVQTGFTAFPADLEFPVCIFYVQNRKLLHGEFSKKKKSIQIKFYGYKISYHKYLRDVYWQLLLVNII